MAVEARVGGVAGSARGLDGWCSGMAGCGRGGRRAGWPEVHVGMVAAVMRQRARPMGWGDAHATSVGEQLVCGSHTDARGSPA